jgi:hypothetical protein
VFDLLSLWPYHRLVDKMKVTKTITSDSETASVLDLFSDLEVSDAIKNRIKDEVGSYLVEQTLLSVADAKSPISGESWDKKLTKEYKAKKVDEGGSPIANLEVTGDMLSALDFESTKDGIKIGVFGNQAPKADGHNNLSGDSSLPTRRFLPDEGQDYKTDIESGVEEIINDIIASETNLSKDDFPDIQSSDELYTFLEDALGIEGRDAIARAVLANADLTEILTELDLLDYL